MLRESRSIASDLSGVDSVGERVLAEASGGPRGISSEFLDPVCVALCWWLGW